MTYLKVKSADSPFYRSPVKVLFLITLLIFLAEFFIEFLFEPAVQFVLPFTSDFVSLGHALSAILLTVIIIPILYLFLFRPLKHHLNALTASEESAREKSKHLQILSNASNTINSTLEISAIMRNLVISAVGLVNGTGGAAGLMIDEKMVFTEYYKNGEFYMVNYSFAVNYGVPGLIIASKKPYISNDTKNDPYIIPEIRERLGLYNLINIPIFSKNGEIVGCFAIHNKKENQPFDEKDTLLLNSLSSAAAVAIENAQMFIDKTDIEKEIKGLAKFPSENPNPIIRLTNDGIILYTNEASRMIMENWKLKVGDYVSDFLKNTVSEVFSSGTMKIVEIQVDDRYYSFNVVPILEGKYVNLYGKDISELKLAEKTLKESEQRFRSAFENTQVGFAIYSPDGRFLQVNRALCEITGYAEKELLSKTYQSITHPDDLDFNLDNINRMLSGEIEFSQFEKRYIHNTGGIVWVFLVVSLVRDENGNPLYIISLIENITERKQIEEEKAKLESQLFHAQKMDAIGQLAGGIAHDFNNILTAIMGYASFLQMKLPSDHPLRNYTDQILSASERGSSLTQSLLAFGRKQIINPKPVYLNETIKKVEKLLSRLIREEIELQVKLIDKKLTVMADNGQIGQVLINLATNARDAMPNGGILTITTEYVEFNEEYVRVHPFSKAGIYGLITVTDTGIGMDEQIKEKIFEPFFTTKETGKGTGLGLSIVYGIIKQHNGYINVYSEPQKGTTFKIYLPLVNGEDVKEETKHLSPLERGTETVLVAEDNENVRDITKMILTEFGYKVIEAFDGEDAIEKYKENKEKIQFLLIDVIMPKKNGKEVYEEIRLISPEIKVLFTSGYTADIIHKKGILDDEVNFISKPVLPEELLRKIREILDGKI